MKTTLQFLFLGLLFLSISSCYNKDQGFDENCISNCIIFSGSVTDPKGEPLSAEIEISHTSGGYIAVERLIGKTETDLNGNFDYRIDGTNYEVNYDDFTVRAFKEGYLTQDREGTLTLPNIDSSNFDIPNIANIVLSPKSTLEIEMNIDSPSNITSIIYSPKYLNSGSSYGIFVDSLPKTYSHTVGGDQLVFVEYSYRKSGTKLEFTESVYIEGGETKKVEINIE